MQKKIAVIIGAGPAGLTVAYELLKRTNIQPIIFEKTDRIGGLACTLNYKGNRMDVGGHRFFSKSSRVMQWWFSIFPLQKANYGDLDVTEFTTGNQKKNNNTPGQEIVNNVMLVRKRLSRILFKRKFFNYPLTLNIKTISKLGIISVVRIVISYLKAHIFPRKPEKSLEDFFINRFGNELYRTFFKDYTEKVWGVPCTQIKPDWGAQRIKELSVAKVIYHALKKLFRFNRKRDIGQRSTETSLIEYFLYPKYGPGQLWEEVASRIQVSGGELYLQHMVIGFDKVDNNIINVHVLNLKNQQKITINVDYVFSTMDIKELIASFPTEKVPAEVRLTAEELQYRDFITVGLLLSRLNTPNGKLPDNWIYVQESDVKLGRIQVFNNWSPYLVHDPNTIWLGLEYFCNEGDELWGMGDKSLIEFAMNELVKLGIALPNDLLDGTVLRIAKAYPAYFGGYEKFDIIKDYLNSIENLFSLGRNGMHRYNNQDHSMLTAMTAVDNIIDGITSKENIWDVNTEQEYQEIKN